MSIAGCHGGSRVKDSRLYERLSRVGRSLGRGRTDEMARRGAAAVVTQCDKASFANVRNGLIVGRTGLREDVFEMRDPHSFRTLEYGLDDTLRMEAMLRVEAKVGGHSAEEAGCIRKFADNLESLTDPLVDADKLQREIDLSAFSKAAKEAQDEKQLENSTLPEITSPSHN